MTAGAFLNKPKILKGALVEYGLKLPPKFVVFQFNPEELERERSVSYSYKESRGTESNDSGAIEALASGSEPSLRSLHKEAPLDANGRKMDHLLYIQEKQTCDFSEESIALTTLFDASENMTTLDKGMPQFGILPELAALEQMITPQEDSLLNFDLLNKKAGGHTFTNSDKPPITLFIWGQTRILPVNLETISINETDFNTFLAPTRAIVNIKMRVIEGDNKPYKYSETLRSAMAALNLRNLGEMANVAVPV